MVTTARSKPAALQQGVSVRVVGAQQVQQEWARMKRDEYDPEMARVAGRQGVILHQHPSGAFTVSFEDAGEVLRFKFPPRALQAVGTVPDAKRIQDSVSPHRPPVAPPSPEPEAAPETPPMSPAAMQRIDSGLKPPPVESLPSDARQQAKDEVRRLAMQEAEEAEDFAVEEECERYASPADQDPQVEEEEDDEEAAFLAALAEEEAAEEEAFLAELDGDDESPAPTSPPPTSPP
eukprot:Hpha_TRINITY_DN15646_c4_g1::TRINITY_DN15646_c4_g1_i1::g.100181::m.100181